MTATCPFCKGKLSGELALPRMSGRQSKVYWAVAKGGPKGIPTHDLLRVMYLPLDPGPGGGIVLRVQIHELNKKLASVGQEIRGAGGSYRLYTR